MTAMRSALTDGDLLLRGILAEPADDTVRLAYADWLQENGQDARAQFIRVQIELAQLESRYGPRSRVEGTSESELEDRERELWRVLDLPAAFPAALRPVTLRYCRRGFVAAVTCSAADWISHARAIRSAHPVTEVTLLTSNDFYPLPAPANGFCAVNFTRPGGWQMGRAILLSELHDSYPGITFHLPASA